MFVFARFGSGCEMRAKRMFSYLSYFSCVYVIVGAVAAAVFIISARKTVPHLNKFEMFMRWQFVYMALAHTISRATTCTYICVCNIRIEFRAQTHSFDPGR